LFFFLRVFPPLSILSKRLRKGRKEALFLRILLFEKGERPFFRKKRRKLTNSRETLSKTEKGTARHLTGVKQPRKRISFGNASFLLGREGRGVSSREEKRTTEEEEDF